MTLSTTAPVNPWHVELVVLTGVAHSEAEQRAVRRDVERGTRVRLCRGVYVARAEFDALRPESQHVVRMRAIAAASSGPVVFSHWSAGVLHRLPVLRSRLGRVHVTVPRAVERHREGVAHHVFPLHEEELATCGGLWTTTIGRTVVDIAGSAGLEEAAMSADRALLQGVPRAVLEAAVDLAGPRRAARRIAQTVAFAHPGGESAAESRARVTCYRLGVEVPHLQREFTLGDGSSAFPGLWFPDADAVLEVDGDTKYLDSAMAPEGAGRAVLAEKRREDELRLCVRALGRIGWAQSGAPTLLRPVLDRIGVRPTDPPTSFTAYCAAARAGRARHSLH